jgi:hypothetical protein
MLPRGFPRNPRELFISSHTERNASHIGRYVTPRETGGTRRDAEQSYEPIVPTRAGNRRASARSGHGTHWREGGNKRTYLPKET